MGNVCQLRAVVVLFAWEGNLIKYGVVIAMHHRALDLYPPMGLALPSG